jgi:RND family efflux transporter MFP subunit
MGYRGLRLRRWRPAVITLTLFATAIVVACSATPAGQPLVAPMTVRTATVGAGTVAGTLVYSGNAESRAKLNLLPKVGGQITVLKIDVGSTVKTGDVIAELDHATQDAQIAQAQAGVDAAKARLAAIQSGPRPELVAQARANLTAANETLNFTKNGGRAASVAAAQGNVDSAAGRLASLQKGRADAVAQATANLTTAQSRLQQLKDGPTAEQIRAAELGVEQAKDAAYAANVSKDAACGAPSTHAACNAGQASAAAAQTGVDMATAGLKVLTAPPTDEQLKQAQAAIDAAQAQVNLAQHPGSAGDVTAAAGALDAARAQLDLARSPFSTADLARAQAAVDVADQQLKLAETPFTRPDEDAAKAAVEQAQASLTAAGVARDQTIVKAPIDAVVAQKLLVVGSVAGPTTPIAVLIDPNVDVVVEAEATQANLLKNGDAATITSDALPGKSIPGSITSISPIVDPRARTIEVRIAPITNDSALKDGMLAQVSLVTATHEGVLTVPTAALVQRNGQSVVYVVSDGVATPTPVQSGLTDGASTEIVTGLAAGQIVVISGQDRLTTSQPVIVQK